MIVATRAPLAVHRPAAPKVRNSKWLTWGVALVVAALLGRLGQAAPITLYDSIGGNTAAASNTADATNWLADEFKTDGLEYQVASVVIRFVSAPLGSVKVDLYTNNTTGNVPGTFLKAFTNPGSLQSGDNTFTMSGSPVLAANSSFWVVLKNSGTWQYTNGTSTGPGASDRWADGSSSGAIWNASNGGPYMMTVSAVAVPEPSTWAMGASGLGIAGLAAFRRRRTAR